MGKEQRLTFYDIAASQAHSVKTFDGKTYELKGTIAIENNTGSIEKCSSNLLSSAFCQRRTSKLNRKKET